MSEWRGVVGYEDYYEVSDHGVVRSLDRVTVRSDGRVRPFKGQTLKAGPNTSGHLVVNLSRNGRVVQARVHQLLAQAFIGPPPPGLEVCHNNGNPADNRVSNIRYGTRSSNQLDRWAQTGKRKLI